MAEDMDENDPGDELTIAAEEGVFIIVKAQEVDEEVEPTEPEFGFESDRRSHGRCAGEPSR